jgi:hypothetical protein
MIVLISEDAELEVIRVRDVDVRKPLREMDQLGLGLSK